MKKTLLSWVRGVFGRKLKNPDSYGDPILSSGLPSPSEIRALVAYFRRDMADSDVTALVRTKDYTAAHELAGYLNCLEDLEDLAQAMEDETAQNTQQEDV